MAPRLAILRRHPLSNPRVPTLYAIDYTTLQPEGRWGRSQGPTESYHDGDRYDYRKDSPADRAVPGT